MDDKTLALLVGGVVPALLFGVTGFLQKYSAGSGMAAGPYLIAVGGTAAAMGIVVTLVERNASFTRAGVISASIIGALWAIGMACIAGALTYYKANISQLVPLYNMNTLVAVVLGLVILSEWRTVNPVMLLLGAFFIVVGGVLAAWA